jgi:membrane-bound serine protease (ClpP class)
VATLGAFSFAVIYLVFRSQVAKVTLGMEGLVGEIGEARARLSPRGKIFVHGEYWNAEGEGDIEVGEKVEVIGFDGMTLKVRRAAANKLAG